MAASLYSARSASISTRSAMAAESLIGFLPFLEGALVAVLPLTGTTTQPAGMSGGRGQVALVPGALLAADVGRVGRADRGETGLGQHLLGGEVLVGGGGPQCAQPVPRRR